VQGLIIVVLIDVQVHLVSRGELRAVQLVVQVVVIVFLILLLLCG
jgi:TRAP-type C4-dicarboxylate transport system permease small subunit